jgi:AcrR family transcriptional regulator
MMPGASTVDAIRRVGLEMFARDGYEATTMRAIAGEVGIQAGSLYNHFASKEEILWDLTQGALMELTSRIRESMETLAVDADAQARLCAFVDAHVRFHALNSDQASIVNRQMAGLSAMHYRQAVSLRATFEAQLGEILQEGNASGEFHVIDFRMSVIAILQMCISVSTWYRADGKLSPNEICAVYVQLAQRMVGLDTRASMTRVPMKSLPMKGVSER